MTLDEREQHEPPGGPQTGNGLLLAGLITAPCAVLAVAFNHLEPWLHDILLYGPGLALVVGVFVKFAERIKIENRGHFSRLSSQLTLVDAMASQVATNTVAIGRLSAGRTVDLHNLHAAEDRMEGLVRTLTVGAIEDLRKEIRAANQDKQYADVKVLLAKICRDIVTLASNQQAIDDRLEAMNARLGTIGAMDSMDPVYLADMAKSVQLGREIEQRKRQDPPNTI